MMNKFEWGGIDNPDVYLDENIRRMCYTLRMMFVDLIDQLIAEGKNDKALKALDYSMEKIPSTAIPHDYISIQMANDYYHLGQTEKATALLKEIADNSMSYLRWYTTLTANQLRSVNRDMQMHQFIMIRNVLPIFLGQNQKDLAMKYIQELKEVNLDPTSVLKEMIGE